MLTCLCLLTGQHAVAADQTNIDPFTAVRTLTI
jgi:hypothetical protein